ncbi:MAG TPA: XdhC/CoxI family protein [Acidimicrobiales bacterium]|nr:XdhC/CoxI family protein [Acidimicrobiales bacterium]
MREILDDIDRWRAAGESIALGRVVGTDGSGPREPGAAMAVTAGSEVAGSVSGGCVEGAVVAEALELLGGGEARLCTFGYSDEQAYAVGLTCGGTVRVFLQPLPDVYDVIADALRSDRPVAMATVVEGPPERLGGTLVVLGDGDGDVHGTLGDPDLDRVVARDARGALESGISGNRHYGACGEARRREVEVFVESFAPAPRMVILGAVDFTAALARVAKILGYKVVVVDARPVFATAMRFPMADEVVVDWPDRVLTALDPPLGPRDAVCVLTHDHKFDVPAILAALPSKVGYLGAMGSRRTRDERERLLREAGVTDVDLARVMAPIGLDLGARTPEETAISICAEIIALRTGRPAPSLRDASGAIHGGD